LDWAFGARREKPKRRTPDAALHFLMPNRCPDFSTRKADGNVVADGHLRGVAGM
jgi:hypothetical protein